jgi:deoxyribonuclease-2
MKLSPLDENGKPVDWWFAYKVPKLTKDASTASTTGYEYVYYDPSVQQVAKSPHKMSDPDCSLRLTLDSAFKTRDATTGWILYNDEKPAVAKGRDDGNLGHTKGVIAFDTKTKTAFWLVHSWPKYADPELPGMPTPDYGQTFLCVSLPLASASKLAAQMVNHQEPQIYDPQIPPSLDKKDPLFALTQSVNANAPADSSVLKLKTVKGLAFQVIAKNRKWGKDFWNDLVGPTLKADMDVETWIRGRIPPTLDSDGIHKTFDVKYIDLSRLGAPWAWPESRDHAKWGITKDSHWVCVGDINRMVSQEKRGGGTIALQDEKLWAALSKTDLILAPPGHTRAQALALIETTHGSHDAQQPAPAPKQKGDKKKAKGK